MTDDSRRDDLAAIVEYIQENADRLTGLGRFAEAMGRMATEKADGGLKLNINGLTDEDVEELLGLAREIAKDNGQVWAITTTAERPGS